MEKIVVKRELYAKSRRRTVLETEMAAGRR